MLRAVKSLVFRRLLSLKPPNFKFRRLFVSLPQASVQKKELEQIYQKMTQREHILLRPEPYIGSCKKVEQNYQYIKCAVQETTLQWAVSRSSGVPRIGYGISFCN